MNKDKILEEFLEKWNKSYAKDGFQTKDLGNSFIVDNLLVFDWLWKNFSTSLNKSYQEDNHFCCKNNTIKIEDFCDDCIKRFSTIKK